MEAALGRLGELAVDAGIHVELLAVGGAVMVLRFGSREATRDVDAAILAPTPVAPVRVLARTVAEEQSLPEDWLNDAAKGFIGNVTATDVLLERPGISVRTPPLPQLLAMKLGAWRDDRDIGDAVTILQAIAGTKDETWAQVAPFLTHGRELTSSLAFETAWELAHGLA